MPAGGLLTVLDDITVILDDVAAMSKIAARKTVAIVGDDLAVNANVVVGLEPNRELPIVGKIALGSLANKAILIPLALALPSTVIQPVLMFGGAFLCYEAIHKILHKEEDKAERREEMAATIESGPEGPKQAENQKVWAAIGTDAILSAEVIAVALGAVADAPTMTKALTLCVVGLAMTIGVYGLVGGIVKVDDVGLHLQKAEGEGSFARFKRWSGQAMVNCMPVMMKGLSVLGTAAMFTVGGGILLHGIAGAEHYLEGGIASLTSSPFLSGPLELLATLVVGMVIGLVSMPVFSVLGKGLNLLKGPLLKLKDKFSSKKTEQPTANT